MSDFAWNWLCAGQWVTGNDTCRHTRKGVHLHVWYEDKRDCNDHHMVSVKTVIIISQKHANAPYAEMRSLIIMQTYTYLTQKVPYWVIAGMGRCTMR